MAANIELDKVEGVVNNDKDLVTGNNFYKFKDLTSDYVEILLAPRPPLCKIIWVIWFLGMAGLGVSLTYTLAVAYYNRETNTEVTTTYTGEVQFPAITLCSLNMFNYTMLNESLTGSSIKDFKVDAMLRAFSGAKIFNTSIFTDLVKELNDLGLDNLFRSCKNRVNAFIVGRFFFAGREIIPNLKDQVATENGYCATFNYDGSWAQHVAGPNGGFAITLDAKIESYLPSTESSGFRVIIHNPGETVLTMQYGYLVATGSQTDIKLTKRKVEKLGAPWGNCTNAQSEFSPDNATKTTIPECTASKKILAYKSSCECLPWWLYDRFINQPDLIEAYESSDSRRNASYEECDTLTYMGCEGQVIDSLNNQSESNKEYCKEPCNSVQYSASLSSATFPFAKYYQDYLRNKVGYNSITDARANLANLRIFFEDLKVETETQSPSYTLSSLIAEVGGTLDLFIGFSFFTVIQLGEIVFAGLINLKKPKKAPGESPDFILSNRRL